MTSREDTPHDTAPDRRGDPHRRPSSSRSPPTQLPRLRPAGPPWRTRAGAGEHPRRVRQGARTRRHDVETDLAVTKDGVDRAEPRSGPQSADRARARRRVARRARARHPDADLAELRRFDVGRINPGTKYAQRFAGAARRPTASVSRRSPSCSRWSLPPASSVRFNIETKLAPDARRDARDPRPSPVSWSRPCRAAGWRSRTTIQSFDWRTLRIAVRRLHPAIETVCLTNERTAARQRRCRASAGRRRGSPGSTRAIRGSVPRLVAAAGCGIWSPNFKEIPPRGGGGACARPPGAAVDRQRRRRHGAAPSTWAWTG